MQEEIDTFITEQLGEIGAAQETIEGVFQMGPTHWVLSFTDDRQVDLYVDEPGNRLVIVTEIGVPPEAGRARAMETLLAMNLMWSQTGGLRGGMLPDGGPASLLVDIGLPDLSRDRIERLVLGLAARAADWRGFFADELAGRADAPDTGLTMIRI